MRVTSAELEGRISIPVATRDLLLSNLKYRIMYQWYTSASLHLLYFSLCG